MPTEQEMLPKDKYTVFDRKVKRYRKGIHSEFSPCSPAGKGLVEESTRSDVKKVEIGEMEVCTWGQMLTICRGAEMDKSQPETEPPWFLSGERWFCVYYMFLYGLHWLWRFSGIKDILSLTIAYIGYRLSFQLVSGSLGHTRSSGPAVCIDVCVLRNCRVAASSPFARTARHRYLRSQY